VNLRREKHARMSHIKSISNVINFHLTTNIRLRKMPDGNSVMCTQSQTNGDLPPQVLVVLAVNTRLGNMVAFLVEMMSRKNGNMLGQLCIANAVKM
jgi:hypothetical protein